MRANQSTSFLEHVEELRRRLVRVLIALVTGTTISAIFTQQFLDWLALNTLIQDWDTYGYYAHNYYLYAAPGEKGVGALLMRALLHKARTMGITRLIAEVFESNDRAVGLYRRFGFEKRGEKVSSGEKLWIMERTL